MENQTLKTLGLIGVILVAGYALAVTLDFSPSLIGGASDAYYTETVSITLQFEEPTAFVLYIPALLDEDGITPAMEPLDQEEEVEFQQINGTDYIVISDNTDFWAWNNTVALPEIEDDTIAYESYLFDHSIAALQGNIIVILEGASQAQLWYRFEADTNLCGIESINLPDLNEDGAMELTQGTTSFPEDTVSFTTICA